MNPMVLALVLASASGASVRVLEIGPNKGQLITHIRDVSGQATQEITKKLERVPAVVWETDDKDRANTLALALQTAGASVDLDGSPVSGGGSSDPATATQSVRLTAAAKKPQVTKALRDAGLAADAAKKCVDAPPCVVRSGLSKADADKLVKKLRGAGAKVETTTP